MNILDGENANSVFRSIFDWSQSRPLWQRDALRRIVQNVSINEQDVSEVFDLLIATQVVVETEAKPLLEDHLPSEQITADPIRLEYISDVKGVNNLAKDQILRFSEKGVTVVYGDNGAGKSGYTRILKNACRARHRTKILSNVFSEEQEPDISSLIAYSKGNDIGREFNWQNADTPHPILSCISVFDRECASVHIQKKNEVAYRPFGLDIPDTLADLSQALEIKLKERKQELVNSRNEIFQNPPWTNDSVIGKLVSSLNENSNIQEIQDLTQLDPNEEERLADLISILSNDANTTLNELENNANNIDSLIKTMKSLSNKLSEGTIETLCKLGKNAENLQEAAKTAATKLFSGQELPGVGDKIWLELWSSARKYSEEVAFIGQEFPASGADDKCLLCQQPLGKLGSSNIRRFDDFVKSNTQDRADNAIRQLNQAKSIFPPDVKLGNSWHTIKQLQLSYPDVAKRCMRFFATSKCRVHNTLGFISGENVTQITPLSEIPFEELNLIATRFREKRREMIEADDNKKREAFVAEKNDLQDRKTIKNHLIAIQKEIERMKEISAINKKISETNTRSITHLGNSLADDVVTPQLSDSFLMEVKGFVGNRLNVDIKRSGGKSGSPEYRVSFLSNPKPDVSTVLSEGEQTCVAIASFLAELSTASHKSALVFDDPISSLDHKWRNKVAERLVREGNERQVIIFTHDLVFLNDLEDYANEQKVPFVSKFLDRKPEIVGIVHDSLPWDGMKIKERIDDLEKEAGKISKNRKDQTEEVYKEKARSFYSKLRTSWERALEEVGLSHTVMRFRDYINPKNINNISALEIKFCQEWKRNYAKCCDFVQAHDSPRGRNQSIPDPEVLISDVATLNSWVSRLRKKQKNID